MRKGIKVMALALTFAVMLTGCKSDDYKKAQSLYDEGKYEEAITMYEALGDYEDSADKLLASKYLVACNQQNAGNYDEAIAIYDEIGDYEKSAENKEKCYLAKTSQLIEEKNYEEALTVVQNCLDSEEGKHFADICNVHINGMDGLIEYMKENIEPNNNGNNAESVNSGKNNYAKDLIYYDTYSNEMKVEVTKRDHKAKNGDPILTITISGENQGSYHLLMDNLKEVTSSYAYYHDTLFDGSKNYVGYLINVYGKIDLNKFKKGQEVSIDKFSYTAVDTSDEKKVKKNSKKILASMTELTLEGIQNFLNEKELRTSLADLGFTNYKTVFAADPYEKPVTTSDYSADNAISEEKSNDSENVEEKTTEADEENQDVSSVTSGNLTVEGNIDIATSKAKAVFKDCYIAEDGFIMSDEHKDKKAIIIEFDYTNLEDNDKSFQQDFWFYAYQNGVELDNNGVSYDSQMYKAVDDMWKTVLKDGTLRVGYYYLLEDDSPVTIKCKNNGGTEEVSGSMIVNLK